MRRIDHAAPMPAPQEKVGRDDIAGPGIAAPGPSFDGMVAPRRRRSMDRRCMASPVRGVGRTCPAAAVVRGGGRPAPSPWARLARGTRRAAQMDPPVPILTGREAAIPLAGNRPTGDGIVPAPHLSSSN